MSRFCIVLAFLLFTAPAFAADIISAEDRKPLYDYGDAMYYAYQGEWFEALARLDARPVQSREPAVSWPDAFSRKRDRAMGDLMLNYRMRRRASNALWEVIEGTVSDDLRKEAIFRLARMYLREDQPEKASQVVELVQGDVPAAIRADLAFLRADIALALGRNAEAVAILKDLQGEKSLEGFSSYNLGIALMRSGNERSGREYLNRTGRIKSDNPATLAIKDKANLVLGEKLLGENSFETAKEVLDRVRLSGPFSNRALLSSGWADASRERFENALVPWSILADRDVTDPAVQEVLLGVPYAYSRLGVYSTAALKYERTLDAFGGEIGKLDASIAGIREGKFIKALAREELKQDANWVVKLRELPETPETLYLLDLMASRDFQEALKNYIDLKELRKNLETWSGDLLAFEDIIRQRRAHYEPLLPAIDREFAQLESEMRSRIEQRDRLGRQLNAMVSEPRPDLLVTSAERSLSEQLESLEKLVAQHRDQVGTGFDERIRRLQMVLYWDMNMEFDKRFAASRRHFDELNKEIERLEQQYNDVVRTRQTVTDSYQGYADVISSQQAAIKAALEKVNDLTARQGQVLEIMAINELTRRRARLEEFQVKARFGLADSYDRAGKAAVQKRDAR